MDDATLRTLPDDPAELKQIILSFAQERDTAIQQRDQRITTISRERDATGRKRDDLLNQKQQWALEKIRLEHKLLAALKRLYGPRADRVMQEADVAQLLLDFAKELEARRPQKVRRRAGPFAADRPRGFGADRPALRHRATGQGAE